MSTTQFITKNIDFKKVAFAAMAASLVLAPLSSQAAPPDHAPAYGYRNKQNGNAQNRNAQNRNVIRDRNNDGYDDRDRDRDGDLDEDDGYDYRDTGAYQNRYGNNGNYNNGYYNNGGYYDNGNVYYPNTDSRDYRDNNRNGVDDRFENSNRGGVFTTITGVVTRDLQGRRFEITSNGRTYVVFARNNEPLRLTRGDQVRVSGRVFSNTNTRDNRDRDNRDRDNRNERVRGNSNFIMADSVRITRNDDQNQNGSRVNFTGRVLDVRGDYELVVRAENGRTYTVRSDNRLSSSIDDNDRVRVTGRLRNGRVEANRVELTDNRNDDNNNEKNIDFKGRVESLTNIFGQRILVVSTLR